MGLKPKPPTNGRRRRIGVIRDSVIVLRKLVIRFGCIEPNQESKTRIIMAIDRAWKSIRNKLEMITTKSINCVAPGNVEKQHGWLFL
jgi:hypothetical protein